MQYIVMGAVTHDNPGYGVVETLSIVSASFMANADNTRQFRQSDEKIHKQ
jgi:hypothetical protein